MFTLLKRLWSIFIGTVSTTKSCWISEVELGGLGSAQQMGYIVTTSVCYYDRGRVFALTSSYKNLDKLILWSRCKGFLSKIRDDGDGRSIMILVMENDFKRVES